MSGFAKLFSSILHSTVWQTPLATKIVWITMLAMSDRDGEVMASVPGLAIAAGVTREECETALACFFAPDPDSRTQTDGGRRIRKIDGGWLLINYADHRDRMSADEQREKCRLRMAAMRQRKAEKAARSLSVTQCHGGYAESREVRQSKADAESDSDLRSCSAMPRGRPCRIPPGWRSAVDGSLWCSTHARREGHEMVRATMQGRPGATGRGIQLLSGETGETSPADGDG